jgi:hypothetical protein
MATEVEIKAKERKELLDEIKRKRAAAAQSEGILGAAERGEYGDVGQGGEKGPFDDEINQDPGNEDVTRSSMISKSPEYGMYGTMGPYQKIFEQGVGDETFGSRLVGTLTKGKLFEAPSSGFGSEYAADNIPIIKDMDPLSKAVYNTVAPYGEKAFDIIDTAYRMFGATAADIAQVAGVDEKDVNEIQAAVNTIIGSLIPQGNPVMTAAATNQALKSVSKAVNEVKNTAKYTPEIFSGEYSIFGSPPLKPVGAGVRGAQMGPKTELNNALNKMGDDLIQSMNVTDLTEYINKNYKLNLTKDQVRKNKKVSNLAIKEGNEAKSIKLDNAINEIGKEKIKNTSQAELRRILNEEYDIEVSQSGLSNKLKKLDMEYGVDEYNLSQIDKLGDEFIKKLTKFIKDKKPYTTELYDEFPELKGMDDSVINSWRKKNKLNIYKKGLPAPPYSKIYKSLNADNKKIVDDFINQTKEIETSTPIQKKIQDLIGRMISRGEVEGKNINEILNSLKDVDIKELIKISRFNSILRKRRNQAKYELGIELDDFNLSHIEDVATDLKNTLKADNLFFLEAGLNQGTQKKLNNKINKILEKLEDTKTEKEKKLLLTDLENIEKEMIDNNIISKLEGNFYGDKNITAEKSFQRLIKKQDEDVYADDPLGIRFKNGGLVGIDRMTRSLREF